VTRHAGSNALLLGLLATIVTVLPLVARQSAPAGADPKTAAALQRGESALRGRDYDGALAAFKQASVAANKSSPQAFYGMARAYHGVGAFKNEADACAEALKLTADDRKLESSVRNQRGLALVAMSDTAGTRALKDAEAEFRAVLALPGAGAVTRYNLGVVLLKQNRDEEGIAELRQYVDSGAKTPEADTARAMMVNPRRAREPFAPVFKVTTLEGEYISFEELVGKVVVLDFWGTWCGPCVAAVPSVVGISKKYAQRPVVILGISSDGPSDRQKVLNFVAANKMTWPEYIDGNRQIERIFDVHSFPTWIIVDAEGIVRDRIEAWGPNTRGDLDRAIDRALKTVPK
jgi:thiol-disulfide isomerase/thioredoxin